MTKQFCDLCEVEITKDTDANIGVQSDASNGYRKWKIAVEGIDHLCIYCLIKELNKRDYRPKVVSA